MNPLGSVDKSGEILSNSFVLCTVVSSLLLYVRVYALYLVFHEICFFLFITSGVFACFGGIFSIFLA